MKVTAKNRALIIAVSMLFILFFKYLPAPAGLSVAAMQVVGIFIGVLIMWMTISIDWPSMLCLAALEQLFHQYLQCWLTLLLLLFLILQELGTFYLKQMPFSSLVASEKSMSDKRSLERSFAKL